MTVTLTSPVTKKSLEKSFDFALKFHLDPKKGQSNRTTGQTRGLGGIADSFLRGKVVELAVVNIFKKFYKNKVYKLDFEVHDVDDSDPDIVTVIENKMSRVPKVFVEIKNGSESNRWMGLHEEQFKTIKKNKIVGSKLDKIFIIYASIKNKNQRSQKKDDLLGVFLKSKIGGPEYEKFSDVKDLYVEVAYVMSAEELLKKGTRFEKGYFFYETEIFREVDPKYRFRKNVKKKKNNSSILPEFRYDKKYPYPKKIGKIKFSGNVEIFEKKNKKSSRMYVYCLTNVKVKNNIIGTFYLKKGKLYDYAPKTLSRNPVLNRNNIWIAQRNFQNIIKKSPSQRVREIAKKI